ncbi:DUF7344 domain-containing protein [Haladaptatus halobius]|uniref:DUF7344 domain-containing protein n=1 Tax=Haladaptatus halobius TaxID=2884875 RepID=UPI001D0B2FFE|nr:hypothetical protein [Haladaptatus halobius]
MSDDSENSTGRQVGGEQRKRQTSKKASETAELSADESCTVFVEPRRRYVLYCLKTSKRPIPLADLADELVRWEIDMAPTAVQDERERIYVSLYHCHLPKLADANLISFDMNRKLVTLHKDTKTTNQGTLFDK